MDRLNTFEAEILRRVSEKYPDVKYHIPYIGISKRDYTIYGMYTYFEYSGEPEILPFLKDEEGYDIIGTDRVITMGPVSLPLTDETMPILGWHIKLQKGRLFHIEMYNYNDKTAQWNGNMDVFTFEEPAQYGDEKTNLIRKIVQFLRSYL